MYALPPKATSIAFFGMSALGHSIEGLIARCGFFEYCTRNGTEMTAQWQSQVRFDLNDAAAAESARRDLRHPLLAPLADILANHRAVLKCQFDAFAGCQIGREHLL